MEGRHALKSINLRRSLPKMCAVSFSVGAAIEFLMCTTGFYNVYNVKQGQKQAEKQREDSEFWVRVEARRKAKESSGIILDD